ncbi:hypothetical protein CABS01_06107 [Colletotrichum abscissum]|nr:uncharacterized protein CABS01_06107 [Colletotrichum abscissum]KAK1518573.1 hypothetical protein CABS01_06107 [Colletotrichum abscissum]
MNQRPCFWKEGLPRNSSAVDRGPWTMQFTTRMGFSAPLSLKPRM